MTPPVDTEGSPVLTATDIHHQYGDVAVLESVSLAVEPGSIHAVIGPNGSGKTTLLRALAGIHQPTSGTVRYHGPSATRPIGYLPQHPRFRPGQSAAQTLGFYAALAGESDAAADEALERVGLVDAADRQVETLSGGMVRLLAIAQASIGDPPVIVLDEPASGLDPEMRMHVFDALTDLATDGTGVVVSSHDLTLVEAHADEVHLIDSGAVVARGSPAEVCATADAPSLHEAFRDHVGGRAGTVSVTGVSR